MTGEKELQEKIQQLQITEQTLQNFSLQKQAFQVELNEVESALKEVEKSKGDLYKITGQIMIKSDKEKITEDLKEKQKLFDLRVKSIEKQEALLQKKLDSLKKEFEEAIKSQHSKKK